MRNCIFILGHENIWSSAFYVESIARFFVQWPQLQRKYPRADYVGCLM
ncbi:hypothetical protein Pint_10041 [Pistacia integerrima]|uniref:Uncharacterized protein n=1 Tax=Pistacia integerrima TaxID=434235 RepID=A0ACC0XJF3_9ROSI|nr:hypothetical protein Pint_10041 [Pistacia integerrima]